jgi:hypothetical protein
MHFSLINFISPTLEIGLTMADLESEDMSRVKHLQYRVTGECKRPFGGLVQ